MERLNDLAEVVLPTGSRRRATARKAYRALRPGEPAVPEHLVARFRTLTTEQEADLAESICTNYFASMEASFGPADDYAASDAGRADIENHLHNRIAGDRRTVVPWLDSLRALNGARILEIGAGMGASTACLAEQGASVTAVDVHGEALRVTERRCQLMGLDDRVKIVEANATTMSTLGARGDFDVIVFFACLEHMTIDERLESLTTAWAMLSPGQHLVIIETPNRLWWYDDHTSMAPFFHWLPDDLAIRYAPLTPRPHFNQAFVGPSPDALLDLARWGRGASFHEFVLALGTPLADLPLSSAMHRYLRRQRPQFLRLLHQVAPDVPEGFLWPYLDLALQR